MTIARTFALGLVATLAATLLFAGAFAQEATPEDDVLQRYELATDALSDAVVALPDDAVEARSALDRAFSALLTLSRGDGSALSGSLERVFERARTAIDNRSETDLAVQAQVLTGGFQRLLFEAALTAAVEGDDDAARGRFLALANDVGLGAARIGQLEAETSAGPLRRIFEAGVAEQVAARVRGLADAGAPDDADVAYRQLARAYADFLLVQDSGRLDPAANERFVTAAQGLVDADDEAYLAALTALAADLAELRDAADAGTPPREDAATDAVVVDLGGDDAPADSETAAESDTADGSQETDATEAPAEGDDVAGDEAAQDEAAPEIDLEALREEIAAEVRAEVEAERVANEIQALTTELTALGVPATRRDELANELHAAGVTSIATLEARVAALAAEFQTAVLRADVSEARGLLAELEAVYGPRRSAVGGTDLAAIVSLVAPDADTRLRAVLDRLGSAPTLRSADASLLVAEVVQVSEALRGVPPNVLQETVASTTSWWRDWIRPAVLIALALLALVPLWLLRLAFGGGNPNWGRVGFALFLLLLPLYVEGVVSAAALLADPLGVPSLAAWSVASAFANPLTQLVWAAVMLLAVLFAIAGFYGIGVQFGVIGRRRNAPASGSARSTRSGSTTSSQDETLVDWDDDEF